MNDLADCDSGSIYRRLRLIRRLRLSYAAPIFTFPFLAQIGMRTCLICRRMPIL